MEEFEFDVKCSTPICENSARWTGWVSHSSHGCPNSSYCCNECKDIVGKWWYEMLEPTDRIVLCASCGAHITGDINDHLRLIRL